MGRPNPFGSTSRHYTVALGVLGAVGVGAFMAVQSGFKKNASLAAETESLPSQNEQEPLDAPEVMEIEENAYTLDMRWHRLEEELIDWKACQVRDFADFVSQLDFAANEWEISQWEGRRYDPPPSASLLFKSQPPYWLKDKPIMEWLIKLYARAEKCPDFDLRKAEEVLATTFSALEKKGIALKGETLLRFAVDQRMEGAALAVLHTRTDLKAQSECLNKAMRDAAEKGLPRLVGALCKIGVSLESRDKYGQTPLMLALDNPQMVRTLLDAGADINATDDEQKSLLMKAIQTKPTHYSQIAETVQILVNNGAALNGTTGEEALVKANGCLHASVIAILRDAGVELSEAKKQRMIFNHLMKISLSNSIVSIALHFSCIESLLGLKPTDFLTVDRKTSTRENTPDFRKKITLMQQWADHPLKQPTFPLGSNYLTPMRVLLKEAIDSLPSFPPDGRSHTERSEP